MNLPRVSQGYAKRSTDTATVKVSVMGYLPISASPLAGLAKMQRVMAQVSLIYKTTFLYFQKRGSEMRGRHQNPVAIGEKRSD